jgi:hypothetical protein
MISRRKLLSSLGLATAIAAFPTVLMVPDAEAQTAGMERRQDRREGRRERREDRRDARQVRREGRREARQVRRGVTTPGVTTPGVTTPGVTTGTAK